MGKEGIIIILTVAILAVTAYGVYLSKESIDLTRESIDLTREDIDLTKENVELTKENVDLTKKALPSEPSISFNPSNLREIEGKILNRLCSDYYECQFDQTKKIIDDHEYYMNYIILQNRGKRINDVFVDLSCDTIDFYGLLKVRSDDLEFKRVYDFSSKIFFPVVDSINYQMWNIIFKANETVRNFTCKIRLVSDEIKEYKQDIIIKMPVYVNATKND